MSDEYSPPSQEDLAQLEADWEAKRVAARELAHAMWIAERFDGQLSQPDLRMALCGELRRRDPTFADADESTLMQVLDDVLRPVLLAKRGDIVEMFVNIYARRLTVEHMQRVTSFYASPDGRQLLMLEPELKETMSFAVSAWISRTVAETIREQRDDLVSRVTKTSFQRMAPP